ncbi:glucosyl-dolichyl phosphate glucuronosyltransferase [Halorubrum gandharaense]
MITTYDEHIYHHFAECVRSVLAQMYDDFEVVIVTETEHAQTHVEEDFADRVEITHVHTEESQNLASARNIGADHAEGDVYAFIDDDAAADPDWLSEIADGYVENDALAVGGKLEADWPDGKPAYLPPEFYWLVGVTHEGFRETEGPVRNTFGANITFRADVFDSLGGFDTQFGKDHGHNLQGEETELCARLSREYREQLYYKPNAVVTHKVYPWQLRWSWLCNRAYWQGYTKRLLQLTVPESTGEESQYLSHLFKRAIPSYIKNTVNTRSTEPLLRGVSCMALVLFVGSGFLHLSFRRFIAKSSAT